MLDADLAAAFDRIDHDRLLSHLGTFPAREQVEGWLKAGVVEQGRLSPTEEGTPQGGVVSPLLLNVALHGMEQAAGVRYQRSGVHAGELRRDSPVLIRYADDLIALCHSQAQAEQVKALLAEWLAPRGLVFNEDKTRVVNLDEGFEFLGFSVRRMSAKLLIKPSKAALRRHRQRLRDEMRSLRGANVATVLRRLVPMVRGWANYYRTVVSSEMFSALDRYLWRLTYKWAKHSHPEEVEALGREPVLRQVQQVPAGRLGFRRPRQRHLPGETRLDEDRPTPDGQGRVVTRRPGLGRVLGQSAPSSSTPTAGQPQPATASVAAGRLSGVRGASPLRRSPAPDPMRVGAVGAHHREGAGQTAHRPPGARHVGRANHPASHTRPLSPRPCGGDDGPTATPASPWACLSRMRGNVHVRF